jgi:hypothetical protein
MDARTRRRASAALLGLGLAAVGCGGSVADQQSLLQPGMVPPLRATQPVAIVAGPPDADGRTIPIVGYDVPVDYLQFTRTAVDRLQQELAHLGIPTAPDASRRIEVRLMYVDLLIQSAGAETACIVDFRVILGDGAVRGLQGREKSGDYEKACDAALTNVTVATLNDPVVQRYIGAPAADGP